MRRRLLICVLPLGFGCWPLGCNSRPAFDIDDSDEGAGGDGPGGFGGESEDRGCDEPRELSLYQAGNDAGGAESEFEIELGTTAAGVVACADGSMHRVDAVYCGDPLPYHLEQTCDGFAPEWPEICDDYDYPDNPSCQGEDCYVYAGCEDDADCKTGEVCACASALKDGRSSHLDNGLSRCVPANCETDVDCGDSECGATLDDCGTSVDGFFCHTRLDECHGHEDCSEGGCRYAPGEQRWLCVAWAQCE